MFTFLTVFKIIIGQASVNAVIDEVIFYKKTLQPSDVLSLSQRTSSVVPFPGPSFRSTLIPWTGATADYWDVTPSWVVSSGVMLPPPPTRSFLIGECCSNPRTYMLRFQPIAVRLGVMLLPAKHWDTTTIVCIAFYYLWGEFIYMMIFVIRLSSCCKYSLSRHVHQTSNTSIDDVLLPRYRTSSFLAFWIRAGYQQVRVNT